MAENTSAPSKTINDADTSAPETAVAHDGPIANGSETKQTEDATATESTKSEKAKSPTKESSVRKESSDAMEKDEAAAVTAESESAIAPKPNGTPSSAKKPSTSKRKSTSGVAEPKNKLNRKKSQVRVTHLDAKPGDYYLARLRSYPPWPSIICDEEMLPQSLLTTRPGTAQRPDGTYKDDYADGGKKVHERTYAVMFLKTNEFAWIPNTDLTPLDPETCKDVPEKGKGKQLLAAYAVAAENHDLAFFKNMLAEHQRALEEEEEEREAEAATRAAAKAEKEAKKKKRKTMDTGEGAEDVEMEDIDVVEKKATSKKRRKEAATDAETEKPAKTPKAAQKLKLTTPKAPAESGKKTPGTGKAKQGAKKAGKAVSSDEGEDTSAESREPEKQVDPKEVKDRREKEILYLRHKLQKGFLTRDLAPQENEMPTLANYFTKLEAYEDLEVSIIRSTKINKVLKMILKLNSIPREEEFKFRDRAVKLLNKWKTVLESETTPAPAEKSEEAQVIANGLHKEEETTPSKTGGFAADKTTEAADTVDEPMPDAVANAAETEEPQAPEPAKEGSSEAGAAPQKTEAETSEGTKKVAEATA